MLNVRITLNNSTTVFAETVVVEPNEIGSFEDVFDRPGTYTITATLDNTTTASGVWKADSQYVGEGGAMWEILIRGQDDIEVSRITSG